MTRWVRADDLLWRQTVGMVLLLHPEDPRLMALPASAAALWELLAEPVTLDTVAARLADRFGEDPGCVAGDVAELLHDLLRRGVVRRVP